MLEQLWTLLISDLAKFGGGGLVAVLLILMLLRSNRLSSFMLKLGWTIGNNRGPSNSGDGQGCLTDKDARELFVVRGECADGGCEPLTSLKESVETAALEMIETARRLREGDKAFKQIYDMQATMCGQINGLVRAFKDLTDHLPQVLRDKIEMPQENNYGS